MAINGLDATSLGTAIGDELKKNYFIGDIDMSTNPSDLTEEEQNIREQADATIERMATAIANAVVSHIHDNLIVTTKGQGNQGAPVLSSSDDI